MPQCPTAGDASGFVHHQTTIISHVSLRICQGLTDDKLERVQHYETIFGDILKVF